MSCARVRFFYVSTHNYQPNQRQEIQESEKKQVSETMAIEEAETVPQSAEIQVARYEYDDSQGHMS